jgi:hypothetical protein
MAKKKSTEKFSLKKVCFQIKNSISFYVKKNYKEYLKLSAEIIIYGVILNFIVYAIFNWLFNAKIIIALGLSFYLIKEELTEIVSRCRR